MHASCCRAAGNALPRNPAGRVLESCGESWREIAWEGCVCRSDLFPSEKRSSLFLCGSGKRVAAVVMVVVVVCQVDERSWRRGVAREKGCN